MALRLSDQHNLQTILHDTLLRWSQQRGLNTILAVPPFSLPADVRVISATGTPLKIKQGRPASGKLVAWPASRVHAKPNPHLVFVIEGVADMDVGVTERMAEAGEQEKVHGLYRLRIPRQNVLIYPAYVPVNDGSQSHSVRDGSGISHTSMLLWVDVLPQGAILHICHTVADRHSVGACTFALDSQLYGITNALVEELQATTLTELSYEVAQCHLRMLLLRIVRALKRNERQTIPDAVILKITESVGEQTVHSAQLPTIKRACDYIERHLDQPLDVKQIARQSFVSPAHLNRTFREEFGLPVMQYVKGLRLEKAKSLLRQTDLPVNTIGRHLGFRNAAYFCRVFREDSGITPFRYRHNLNETTTNS